MSDFAKTSSRETSVTPSSSARLFDAIGSYARSFMSKPWACFATSWPMLPSPTMPRVLPVISRPMNFFLLQPPARVSMSASTRWRKAASIIAKTSSATALALAPGVFITSMFLRRAYLMSIVL